MLITNATVVTGEAPNRILSDHAVLVAGGHIEDLGPARKMEASHPKAKRLDAAGQLLMPGAICAHTHFYSMFARGLRLAAPQPADFPEILQRLWWPLDAALSEEDIRVSALLGMADAIRNGTTTLFDHHSSASYIDGSLDVIEEAAIRAGVRAVLCYEVSDRHGPSTTDAAINENLRFLRRRDSNAHPRLAAMFGLHASLTLSGATLQACRSAAPAGVGFHIHVAEHEQDQYDSLTKSSMRVVQRLENHGILSPRTIAAHCVHVDAAEIGMLNESRTWVAHQPRSNMNNAVGVAPVESMLRCGVRVCLGNDGLPDAMWQEWTAAHLVQKTLSRDPRRMPPPDIMGMAMQHGADLAHEFFPGQEIGRVVLGASADLILVDYPSPTPINAGNFPWHALFGLQGGMVTTTMVAGKILMKDRQLTTLDEAALSARARELAPRVWKRFEEGAAA